MSAISGPDKKGNRDNLRIIFLLLLAIHCDPSLEWSCGDGCREGSHNICFIEK